MALPGFDVAAVWLCSVLAADESDIVGRRQEEEKTTSIQDKKKQYKDIKWILGISLTTKYSLSSTAPPTLKWDAALVRNILMRFLAS